MLYLLYITEQRKLNHIFISIFSEFKALKFKHMNIHMHTHTHTCVHMTLPEYNELKFFVHISLYCLRTNK